MDKKAEILLPIIEEVIHYKQWEEEQIYKQMQFEEENRYITVTREMALDAQDLSLEGQIWVW